MMHINPSFLVTVAMIESSVQNTAFIVVIGMKNLVVQQEVRNNEVSLLW